MNRRFWLCVAGAAASLALGWFVPGAFLTPDASLTRLLLVTALQETLLIGIPALLIALRSARSWQELKGLVGRPDPMQAGLSMLGAVAFTMAGLLITLAAYLLLRQVGLPPDAPPAVNPATVPELLVSILCAALIPAVCEELMFRGVMWASVTRRLGARWSRILTAALFAGLHFTLLGFPVLLALGVVLARVMERRRSLMLCVLFHAMYNASVIVINYSGSTPGLGVILASTAIAFFTLKALLKEETHGTQDHRV